MNYHSYMKTLRTEMNIAFIQNSLSVATIQEILQLPDGKSDKPINIFAILSGGASAAGAIPGNAAWAAATTAFSAVFSLAGELAPTSYVFHGRFLMSRGEGPIADSLTARLSM